MDSTSAYSCHAQRIKLKIEQYSDLSVIDEICKLFNSGAVNIPVWCCFLLLKWKLSSLSKSTKHISPESLNILINEIMELQSEAIQIKPDESIDLKIRLLLAPQLLHQLPEKELILHIARQYDWFVGTQGGYFSRAFKEITGLSLIDYYGIAINFFILTYTSPKVSQKYSLSDVIVSFHPKYGRDAIINFISILSVTPKNKSEFLKNYSPPDNPVWEFFVDTPFLRKPFILHDNTLIIPHKSVLFSSLNDFVWSVLKQYKKEGFKTHFGTVMESYIGDLINDMKVNYRDEKWMRNIYSKHSIPNSKNKVVDFIIFEEEATVFIDSKAIEPCLIVQTSDEPSKIQKRLEDSFIKGVVQGQCCANFLSKANEYQKRDNDCIIIITHKDHAIPEAGWLIENIDGKLESRITNEIGYIPIDFKRAYYMTVEDFEYLVDICKKKNMPVSEVISYMQKNDGEFPTKKLNAKMHLLAYDETAECSPQTIETYEVMCDEFLIKRDAVVKFWSGKVECFINLHLYMYRKLHNTCKII